MGRLPLPKHGARTTKYGVRGADGRAARTPYYINPGRAPMSPPPLAAAEQSFQDALARLRPLLDAQRDALDRAADLCTTAIARDGLVHLFGCGHSRMLCEEMTPRQGCFVGWHTIV